MNFTPKPLNDFDEFIDTYFARCKQEAPTLRVIAGKWRFEDLIPGMSDFDTRFIVADGVTTQDWMQMSLAVGRVHTELAIKQPRWARILEHLPGLNQTLREITDPVMYYPEFKQWTYYRGEPAMRERIETYLRQKPWSQREELYHLKKIATYIGPYQRGIDPAVNMGAWESKYPLHSRYMHYFSPPVQAGVSLMRKQTIKGKFEALRMAREIFPRGETIDRLFKVIDRHYEIPEMYEDAVLRSLEVELDEYLNEMLRTLAGRTTLIELTASDGPAQLKAKVAAIPADPAERFYEGVKFTRFMKGRLIFYAQNISSFDSVWLVRNELGRIVKNFYETPLITFAQATRGRKMAAADVLDELVREGKLVTPSERDRLLAWVRVASRPIPEGGERQSAMEAVAEYDVVVEVMEKLGVALREHLGKSA